jgi:hypothetical protein
MPCYDPPYDNSGNIPSAGLQARERVEKYVAQLTDIENYCRKVQSSPVVPTPEGMAEKIIEMIHAPWRNQ